jgi:hypothetical protein
MAHPARPEHGKAVEHLGWGLVSLPRDAAVQQPRAVLGTLDHEMAEMQALRQRLPREVGALNGLIWLSGLRARPTLPPLAVPSKLVTLGRAGAADGRSRRSASDTRGSSIRR